MTIYDYLESLKIDYTAKSKLFSIFAGRGDNSIPTFSAYLKWSRKMEMPADFKIPEKSLLELLTEVNRMVKDESCPNNLKNRFYTQKKKVLRRMVRDGRASDIWDQGEYYSMIVDGQYQFHQPKEYLNFLDITVAGSQPYSPGEGAIPFDRKTYNDFQVVYHIFIGREQFAKYGNSKDPRMYSGKKYQARQTG